MLLIIYFHPWPVYSEKLYYIAYHSFTVIFESCSTVPAFTSASQVCTPFYDILLI